MRAGLNSEKLYMNRALGSLIQALSAIESYANLHGCSSHGRNRNGTSIDWYQLFPANSTFLQIASCAFGSSESQQLTCAPGRATAYPEPIKKRSYARQDSCYTHHICFIFFWYSWLMEELRCKVTVFNIKQKEACNTDRKYISVHNFVTRLLPSETWNVLSYFFILKRKRLNNLFKYRATMTSLFLVRSVQQECPGMPQKDTTLWNIEYFHI